MCCHFDDIIQESSFELSDHYSSNLKREKIEIVRVIDKVRICVNQLRANIPCLPFISFPCDS